MKRHRVSHPARGDIREVFLHIRKRNPAAATAFRDRLTEVFVMLGEMPGMGRRREEFDGDLRSFSVPPYIVFYELEDDGIVILRVIHGSRDIDELLS